MKPKVVMHGAKVAILGFGREGKSILRFVKKQKQYRGREIWILDRNHKLKIPKGALAQLGKNYLRNLSGLDLIFRSPGIPYELPELRAARKSGVWFSSATRLFFERCPAKNIIGVTGTKGKGTTSTLIYKILRAGGRDVFLAGNIGKPALEIMSALRKNSWVVLELSSFQLQDLSISPHIAVVLDVFPDHQDAHLNLGEYYEAKTSIANHQKRGDKIFFFKNNARSRWLAQKSRGKKIAVDENKFALFGPQDLKIPGAHNFKNAAMAATVAQSLGVPKKIILKTVKNFRGLEHRLEFVREIRGVKFYNDSASTNPQTTAAAMHAFPNQQKILIAGGQDKGLDYKPLADALKNSNAKLIILFGENKKKIQKAIKGSGAAIKSVEDLKTAVGLAYKFAKKLSATRHPLPTAIIFSPGAASFDMFKNYADRGERFKKIVCGLNKINRSLLARKWF